MTFMQRMYQASDVRPKKSEDIFKIQADTTGDEVTVIVDPVVFKVPERAPASARKLFIVVKGWLTFKGPFANQEPLRADSFGTSVGYFRIKSESLLHTYGVHYDCDENGFGHPVFHAQMKSQIGLLEEINRLFPTNWTACDRVKEILRNVRTPSAEMDIFSVFLQICGDHLIYQGSGRHEKAAFSNLLESCGFFTGAAERMPNLHQKTAPPYCYRSRHWYQCLP